MITYAATDKGPLKVQGYVDPSDVTIVLVHYAPPDFAIDTVYHEGDIVKPSVDTGYYYVCTTSGKSAGVEPTWASSVTSGTAVFAARSWDLYLSYAETLISSSWAADNGVTLISSSFSDSSTNIKISAIPALVTSFTITNHVTKSNGEALNRSFKFKVNEQ